MRDERRDVTAHLFEQYNVMPYRYDDDDDDDDDGRDAVWMLGLIYNNREREVRWLLNVQVSEIRLTMIHFDCYRRGLAQFSRYGYRCRAAPSWQGTRHPDTPLHVHCSMNASSRFDSPSARLIYLNANLY